MATGMLSMALVAAIGAGPGYSGSGRGITPVSHGVVYDGSGSCNYGGYGGAYGGPAGGGYPGELPAYGAYPGNDQLWPYDSQLPWMHGYFQEMPAYGGFVYYRPYNYKHVMPQAQVAAGWGMSPTMPYSHQFWHRFQQEASMSPPLSDYRSRPMPSSRFATSRPSTLGVPEYMPAGFASPE